MSQRRFLVAKDVLDERLELVTSGDREHLRRRNADGCAKLCQKVAGPCNRRRVEHVDDREGATAPSYAAPTTRAASEQSRASGATPTVHRTRVDPDGDTPVSHVAGCARRHAFPT
jgi:hypothetical protein